MGGGMKLEKLMNWIDVMIVISAISLLLTALLSGIAIGVMLERKQLYKQPITQGPSN